MMVFQKSNVASDILQLAEVQEQCHCSSSAFPPLCDRLKLKLETICDFLEVKLRRTRPAWGIGLSSLKYYYFRPRIAGQPNLASGRDCENKGLELGRTRWYS
jgi:hypothetical protein